MSSTLDSFDAWMLLTQNAARRNKINDNGTIVSRLLVFHCFAFLQGARGDEGAVRTTV